MRHFLIPVTHHKKIYKVTRMLFCQCIAGVLLNFGDEIIMMHNHKTPPIVAKGAFVDSCKTLIFSKKSVFINLLCSSM